MTESEVIKELHGIRPRGGIIPQKRAEALDVAIQALEEVEQYRAIGTPEECRALKDRLVAPLCIVQDRYGGCYSGAEYLAFNMEPYLVTELDVDAGDMSCRDFWEYEAKEYIIGKGNTPLEALCDLQIKLTSKK